MAETRGKRKIPSRIDFQAIRDRRRRAVTLTLVLVFLIVGGLLGLLALHLSN